jgi:hypothetical protein
MKSIVFRSAGLLAIALGACSATASPVINGATIATRVFNDNPGTTLSTTNTYPAQVLIEESGYVGGGFANLHNFSLSDDGGANPAVFLNEDGFTLEFDFTLSGSANGEGGMRISPWWSQDVDGRFQVRTTDGEIACFGGRVPFYSFTASHGLTYTKGDTVHMKAEYKPNGLNAGSPGTMQYWYTDGSGTYTSGVLNFDEGNTSEDPPHGLWGILSPARVGGIVQPFVSTGADFTAEWGNIEYTPEPASAAMLALLGGMLLRRRS